MSTEDIDAAIERARQAAAEAESVQSSSTEIAATSGVDVAAERKLEMVARRAAAMRAKQDAENAQKEAKVLIDREKDRLQQMMWNLEREMAPMREKLALMGDGIDALNIFLGRDEEIIPIRDGERAPADEIISVRQMVLAMDEESLIAADEDGIDFRNIDDFTEWLMRSESHIEQIIPEIKSVVALIPRRAEKRYGDPWMQDAADKENNRTYWLIRNGECLWLTTTEFTVGDRVVPTDREFTDLFVVKGSFGRDDHPMQPGTSEWEKAEKAADKRTRHYMKVALLLEGLVERTTVFHPHEGVSFLDQSHYDTGRVRVILDAENALSSGRPSFRDWQREKMSNLREGMRIVGAFASRMRTYSSKDSGSDTRPDGATPSNDGIYIVREAESAYRSWTFSFERMEANVWDDSIMDFRRPKTKGTGYLSGSEEWVVPLDSVTIEEIDYYLNSRTERHAYLSMVPTLRAAREIILREQEEESPFLAALTGHLTSEGVSVDDAPALAADLIRWYKTANKWNRPLDRDDERASRAILREARRRRGGSGDMIDRLRGEYPDAIAIARRTSDIVVVERPVRRYASEAENIYVHVHTHGLRGALKETKEWTTLRRSQTARWTVMHSTPAWETQVFDVKRGEHFTDDDIDDIIEFARKNYQTLAQVRIRDGKGADVLVLDDPDAKNPHWYPHDKSNGDGLLKSGFVRARRGYSDEIDSMMLSTDGISGGERDLTSSYWGEAKRERAVWEDEKVIAIVTARKDAEEARRAAARAITSQVIGALRDVESAWQAEQERVVFDRFLEDFGDESLWEGHRRTLPAKKYPGESAYDAQQHGSWHYRPKPLTAALRARIERGDTLAGMSVREIVSAENGDIEKVDASIRDLRLPKGGEAGE